MMDPSQCIVPDRLQNAIEKLGRRRAYEEMESGPSRLYATSSEAANGETIDPKSKHPRYESISHSVNNEMVVDDGIDEGSVQ